MLIAFCLTFASMLIDRYLKVLSNFEKYTDLNKEYASRVYKGFLLKYLNSGVLILLLNLKIRITSNFSIGQYDDLTPIWYATIGYSVVFTLCLKFVSLVCWTGYRFFFQPSKRCMDRGCGFDASKTKKKSMTEYIALYMGAEYDIDFSYTEALKTVLICMTFGPILPIVYPISLIHLMFLYWRDKILRKFLILTCLVLTEYRIPPYFDRRINRKARKILSYGIIMFSFSAIWTFGNPNILEKTDIINFDAQAYSENVVKKDFNSLYGPLYHFFGRSTNLYGVPFFLVLIICLVIFILR